ncbi:hypothetical protein SeMB42_g06209 [Synchytrium endobioticum]|uniref:Uncharacterized protein n=1 Tax=Synchytrium endobioticum TaxID=286115 RepID=A0A507CJF6_9FUNG|nr:hypothetical protein SeMB42_g06209 [Synchytrium endobioticum]
MRPLRALAASACLLSLLVLASALKGADSAAPVSTQPSLVHGRPTVEKAAATFMLHLANQLAIHQHANRLDKRNLKDDVMQLVDDLKTLLKPLFELSRRRKKYGHHHDRGHSRSSAASDGLMPGGGSAGSGGGGGGGGGVTPGGGCCGGHGGASMSAAPMPGMKRGEPHARNHPHVHAHAPDVSSTADTDSTVSVEELAEMHALLDERF